MDEMPLVPITTSLIILNASTPTEQAYKNVEILPLGVNHLLNILMVIITLLGLAGNGTVCYLFVKKRVRGTYFNILLLNLSVADILADIFAYPHVFVDLKMLRTVSHKNANLICAFTIGITPFSIASAVSVLTLCLISVSRFILIKYPLKSAFVKNRMYAIGFIAFVWPASTLLILPNVFTFSYDPVSAICYRNWKINIEINPQVYIAAVAFLGLIIPIGIMFFTFVATAKTLWSQKSSISTGNHDVLKKKRNAVKLLGILILAFFICWGPSFIYLVLSRSVKSVFPDGEKGEYARMRVIRIVFLIALCNTFADPLIYGLRAEDFRKGFADIFARLFHHKKVRANTLSTSSTQDIVSKESGDHHNRQTSL